MTYTLSNDDIHLIEWLCFNMDIEYVVNKNYIYFYIDYYLDDGTLEDTYIAFYFRFNQVNFYEFNYEGKFNLKPDNKVDFLLDIYNYFKNHSL